jgi:hypothetical protein
MRNGTGAAAAVLAAVLGFAASGCVYSVRRTVDYVPRAGLVDEAPSADPGYDLPPIRRPESVRVVRRTTVVRTVPVYVETPRTRVVVTRRYGICD